MFQMKEGTSMWNAVPSIISIGDSMICSDIWHKYNERYFEIVVRNFTSR